jgi:hypothetical protein
LVDEDLNSDYILKLAGMIEHEIKKSKFHHFPSFTASGLILFENN